jgi:hypothetical protein
MHPEITRFLGNLTRNPWGVARAAVLVLRIEAAVAVMRAASTIAPNGHVVEAGAAATCVKGHNHGEQAHLLMVAHDPMAGCALAQGIGQKMAEHQRDMVDLAGLYGEADAPDPFAKG